MQGPGGNPVQGTEVPHATGVAKNEKKKSPSAGGEGQEPASLAPDQPTSASSGELTGAVLSQVAPLTLSDLVTSAQSGWAGRLEWASVGSAAPQAAVDSDGETAGSAGARQNFFVS